jgi:hypothetical protein
MQILLLILTLIIVLIMLNISYNSYSVEISNDEIESIGNLSSTLPDTINTNTVVTSTATLDFGTLRVATELTDKTDINDEIFFDVNKIKVRIEETTAIPQEFKAEDGQVQPILVTPGDYKVTPFLVIDNSFRPDINIEVLVPLAKLIDEDSDINDGDGDENLLEFIGDCDSSITKDQEKFCAIKIVLDQEDIDDIIRFLNGQGLESGIVFEETLLGSDTVGGFENQGSFKFNEMILHNKTKFLNVENIVPNSTINTSSITCFIGRAFSSLDISLDETNCNSWIIFEKKDNQKMTVSNFTPGPIGQVNSYKLLYVVQNGIPAPISACASYDVEKDGGPAHIRYFNCKDLFIAYE